MIRLTKTLFGVYLLFLGIALGTGTIILYRQGPVEPQQSTYAIRLLLIHASLLLLALLFIVGGVLSLRDRILPLGEGSKLPFTAIVISFMFCSVLSLYNAYVGGASVMLSSERVLGIPQLIGAVGAFLFFPKRPQNLTIPPNP